jgi:rapamycin-insensitive companion of mTOR
MSNQPSHQNPQYAGRTSLDREGSGLQPSANVSARNMSSSAVPFGARTGSFNPAVAPGSFSSDMRSQMMPSRAGSRMDVSSVYPGGIMDKVDEDDMDTVAEQTLVGLKDRLNRELKIREGSENMLEALNSKKAKQVREQRLRVEAELSASNTRIKELRQKITDAQRGRTIPPTTPTRNRTQDNAVLRSPPSASRSMGGSEADESTESPTFALAELLQALEVEGMTPEYYVTRANQLVDLFKRHPTLKYDLVWSIFGMRVQMMLLSESREVVAAGYRMTRYAVSDRLSLKKIRSLNTDYLVVRYVFQTGNPFFFNGLLTTLDHLTIFARQMSNESKRSSLFEPFLTSKMV